MHRKKLSLAVAQALGAGILVGLAAPAALGQQYQEKITVTGTRIPTPNLESTSPISVVTPIDIKIEHPVSVENLINNMPQVFADQGNMLSNAATGTADIDLRGLGSQRTLVLLNGRRLPAGDPFIFSTDINMMPLPLIERVDIYTGGASAVYGSDAISGVVNFIINERFQGVQFDWGHSFYNHQQGNGLANVIAARALTNPSQFKVPGDVDSDGEVENYSVAMGSDFANGKGNATVFLGYTRSHPVLQRDRDYSACATGSDANGLNCTGSSTSFPGRFTNLSSNGSSGSFTIANSAGNVRPFASATDQFNFGPYNFYQRPDERYLADFFAHYDITPWMRSYTEFQFMDDRTLAQIAPGGIFFGGPGSENALTFDNPLLSADFKSTFGITPSTPGDVLIGRRNIEGGGRLTDLRHTDYRGLLGFKGELPFASGWDYDLWYQMGKNVFQSAFYNDFSGKRILNALDVVTDPTTGQPVCRSGPPCVPYDIFHLGGVTQAALDYLQVPAFQTGFTEQSVFGATLGADLGMYGWRLPWAKDGVGVSFGLERRTEKLELHPDVEYVTADLTSFAGATLPIDGRYTVKEAYTEVRVPIIQDRPWAQLLSVNGSYRYSDYDINGTTTNTYGIGAEWAPIKEARLRGSYQQAVRAPNIIELFHGQNLNLFNMNSDPCGTSPTGAAPTATLAQCLRTGLPANLYGSDLLTNPAGQYNYLQGGNTNLTPERSKSYTLGVVLTPMRNLSGSIDYWKIKVDNAVGVVDPSLSVTQCINSGQFCDLIHRNALGNLWTAGGFVSATNINLGKYKTSGMDFTANYTQPLGTWGSLGVNFVGTWTKEFVKEPVPGLGDYDCAGFYGATCGVPRPNWKHKLRGTWSTPWNVDVSATWRHIDSVDVDLSSGNPLLAGDFFPVVKTLSARDYIDLAGSWAITKNFTLWAGVNNVFDKDPPITSSSIAGPATGNGNTYPQVYDALGRRIFISLTAKF
ncbi:MAG TPA: TonB-dependent receptor [Terriglobia bacterium]|nr:TonB-dependent receptor [Terriglobia bacterium]